MPVGIRRAGAGRRCSRPRWVLSAALNSLATSAITTQFYSPYRRACADEAQRYVRAARGFTTLFAGLMVLILCHAFRQSQSPPTRRTSRIIPSCSGSPDLFSALCSACFSSACCSRAARRFRTGAAYSRRHHRRLLASRIFWSPPHIRFSGTIARSSVTRPFTPPDWLPQRCRLPTSSP